jgi:toxin-antitoxin system PIN domain toxin
VSYSIDVNILLYASDHSSSLYSRARDFLKACGASDEPLYLSYLTVMSYVRMSTHSRIFTKPLTPAEAMENVEALASLPQARLIGEREGFLQHYKDVTKEVVVRANLVPDAHLLSILRQHGVSTLYTTNVGDFRKLGCPDPRNPLA